MGFGPIMEKILTSNTYFRVRLDLEIYECLRKYEDSKGAQAFLQNKQFSPKLNL